jgi:hypothetical protein
MQALPGHQGGSLHGPALPSVLPGCHGGHLRQRATHLGKEKTRKGKKMKAAAEKKPAAICCYNHKVEEKANKAQNYSLKFLLTKS